MRKALFGMCLVACGGIAIGGCASSSKPANTTNNTTTSGWMSGGFLSSKSEPAAPVAERPKSGPDLYVAAAHMHEQSGNFDGAKQQYERALKENPNDLSALLGYAHLLDRQNQFETATKYYKHAVRKHPKDPTAHNDLGMCYARQAKYDEAAAQLKLSVKLRPEKVLYRNNLANVLVVQKKDEEALAELKAVHGEAVAHYNLAYLLQQQNRSDDARLHFVKASQLNPTLIADAEAQNKRQMQVTTAEQYRSPGFARKGATIAPPLRDSGNIVHIPSGNYPSQYANVSPQPQAPVQTTTPGLAQPALGLNGPANAGPSGIAPSPSSPPPYLGNPGSQSTTMASGMRYPLPANAPRLESGAVAPAPQGGSDASGVESLPPIEAASYNGPFRR